MHNHFHNRSVPIGRKVWKPLDILVRHVTELMAYVVEGLEVYTAREDLVLCPTPLHVCTVGGNG